MNRAKITKLSPYRFEISYPGHEPLHLDFQPLHFGAQKVYPCNQYVLKHWQAKPRGERRFGLYYWRDGDGWYSCHASPEVNSCLHYDLQLPEIPTLPSAALFYPGAVVLDNKIRSLPGSTAIGLAV